MVSKGLISTQSCTVSVRVVVELEIERALGVVDLFSALEELGTDNDKEYIRAHPAGGQSIA